MRESASAGEEEVIDIDTLFAKAVMNFSEMLAKAKAKAGKTGPKKASGNSVGKLAAANSSSTAPSKAAVAAASGEKIVDFIIIGVQKAGTSAAVVNLTKHPDIWLKPGQVHYFDRWYPKGVKHYRDLMRPDKSGVKLVGEKTPTYIYCDGCMERIKELAPKTKFLLFLREPTARAYSHWNMVRNNMKEEDLPFAECVDRELTTLMKQPKTFGNALSHYVQRGFYMEQINKFLKVFPREQLCVVIAERIRAKPVEEHQRIFDFLGVDTVEIAAEDVHLGKYKEGAKEATDKAQVKLKELYRPHNECLFEWLGERIPEWE